MHFSKKTLISLAALLLTAVICVGTAFSANSTYKVSSSYASSSYYSALKAVTLTDDARANFVKVARSQLGYHEGGSSGDLSGHSSSGGNYTEYGYWIGNQGAWCANFVSWCAAQAGISKSVIPYTSCARYSAYADMKIVSASGYTPKPGDIVLVGTNGSSSVNHVGIVSSVSSSTISTIEGNCSNKVKQGSYSTGSLKWGGNMKILYYAVPNFSGAKVTTTEATTQTTTQATTKPTTTKPTTTKPTTEPTTKETTTQVTTTKAAETTTEAAQPVLAVARNASANTTNTDSGFLAQMVTVAIQSANLLANLFVTFVNSFFGA